MATTVTAIRTALETTIAACSVADLGSSKTALTLASTWREGSDRPEMDKDREFWLGNMPAGQTPYIGNTSDTLVESEIEIYVGHKKKVGGKTNTAMGRRDRDSEAIARHLENPSNFPTGVCVVELLGVDYEDSETHWITRMRFALTYDGAR